MSPNQPLPDYKGIVREGWTVAARLWQKEVIHEVVDGLRRFDSGDSIDLPSTVIIATGVA
jgi:hypothetical protein